MTWYAYGEIVLDRALSVDRCSEVSVYFTDPIPTREEILESLGLRDDVVLSLTNTEPSINCNVDLFSLWPDGTIRSRPEGFPDEPAPAPAPSELKLTTPELSVEDVARLEAMIRRYPELQVAPALRGRLAADLRYFRSVAREFPGVNEALLVESETANEVL